MGEESKVTGEEVGRGREKQAGPSRGGDWGGKGREALKKCNGQGNEEQRKEKGKAAGYSRGGGRGGKGKGREGLDRGV